MFKRQLKLLLSFALALAPLSSWAATSVTGSIINPVWTADNSPYVIAGTMEVAAGATLVIEPGTQVRFNQGAKIVVHGTLKVMGTDSDPVMLTSNLASPGSGDWSGIEFAEDSQDAVFKNGVYESGSIVQGAIIKFGSGIICDDSSPYITDNQIINNTVGVHVKGDNAPAGSLVPTYLSADTDNAAEIVPIRISDNTFNDNGVGIKIERNNGRDYVSTPVGYSYIGDKAITARIEGNSIDSNVIGILAIKGDNNLITDNDIRYSTTAGISLESGSQGNILENNIINNNQLGVISYSAGLFMIKNEIKYNSDSGLMVAATPKIIKDNNIYGNLKYNLQTAIFGLKASGNYFGSGTASKVAASIYTASSSSVIYEPLLSVAASTTSVMEPVIDSFATSTLSFKQIISGLKPLDADVYINGQKAVSGGKDIEWSYSYILQMGDNDIEVYYQLSDGRKSNQADLTIFRQEETIIPVPRVNTYPAKTTASSIVISGTKQAGTSLWIDSKMVIGPNQDTTWQYTLPLGVGVNKFNLMSTDSDNKASLVVAVSIERTVVTVSDVVSQEKAASTAADTALMKRLAGRLLLQVENKGYIWYVNPEDNKRYFISQESALDIFRKLSLGITEANLNLIPTKESGKKGDTKLRTRLKGKLLLRVENKGSVSYVDVDGYRHDISQANLMDIFRSLSLGISNENIRKMTVGELK